MERRPGQATLGPAGRGRADVRQCVVTHVNDRLTSFPLELGRQYPFFSLSFETEQLLLSDPIVVERTDNNGLKVSKDQLRTNSPQSPSPPPRRHLDDDLIVGGARREERDELMRDQLGRPPPSPPPSYWMRTKERRSMHAR